MPKFSFAVALLALLGIRVALAHDEHVGPYTHAPRSVRDRDVDQKHLRVDLKVDLDKQELAGRVVNTLSLIRPLSVIRLDAVGMKIEKVKLGEEISAQELKFVTHEDQLEIALDHEHPAGETLRLAIDYHVSHPMRGGHFVAPDGDAAHDSSTGRMFWTQGEPDQTRYWIPCVDSPADRLTSETWVTVPKQYSVISNGKPLGNEEHSDGTRTFHWAQQAPHVTYLMSVVAAELEAYEQSWDSIPIVAYVPKGRLADAERSFKKVPQMVEYFSQRIGVRYPWAKYAQSCVAEFPGGMENTSATTLTDTTLHDERTHLDFNSDRLLSHELAHQWFGDLLTCKDWSETWLNEGFATYFATVWTEHDLGADEATWARRDEIKRYFESDARRYRRPIVSYTYDAPYNMFDADSYPKGARTLHMLRFVLGEDLFWKGIEQYAKRHRQTVVETADLRIAMEKASGQGLKWFFDEWLFHAGYPEFQVNWRWDPAANDVVLTVRQKQKVDELTPLFRMPVEIEVADGDKAAYHRITVSLAEETFHLPATARPTRVCFDPKDWVLKKLTSEKSKEELLDQLTHDANCAARAEAVDGLLAFAQSPTAVKDDTIAQALGAALTSDAFWGPRQQAAIALGKLAAEPSRQALSAAAQNDAKSSVRIAAIEALGNLPPKEETQKLLRQIIAKDQSYYAVAKAIRSLAKIDRSGSQPDLLAALETPSHREVILQAACEALAEQKDPAVAEKLFPLVEKQTNPERRVMLLTALAKLKKDDPKMIELLGKELDCGRPEVRRAVIEGLQATGDARAIDLLVARRPKEIHSRMILAVDDALVALRSKEPTLERMHGEIETLRKQNQALEGRLKKLEEANKTGDAPKKAD